MQTAPKHVKERLGVPYVTGRARGSGIGFAFAREVFERHGGQIDVRSTRGSGTTISVRLPAPGPVERALAG